MIPEFVGRLPVVATLTELDQSALVEILTGAEELARASSTRRCWNSRTSSFVSPTTPSKRSPRRRSARNVGARGLKIIIEDLMLDVMYQIPSDDDIEECVITRDVVKHHTNPITILRKAG